MNQSQCGENLGIFLNNLKEPKNEAKKKNNKNEKGNKKRQILEQPQKKLLETFKRLKEAHNRTKNPSIPPPCPTSTPNISKESRNIFNYPKSRLPPSPPTHPAWERWRYSNNPGRVFFLGNLETVSSQLKRISTFIPRLSVSVPPLSLSSHFGAKEQMDLLQRIHLEENITKPNKQWKRNQRESIHQES